MSQSQSPTRTRPVRRARPTTAQEPVYGILGSAVFHGLILAAAFFTLQTHFDPAEETHIVPVDLVTIADKTDVAAMSPPPPAAPQPEKFTPPPPPDITPIEPRLQDAEPAPDAPMPKFDVAKEKPVEPPKPDIKPVDQPKPQKDKPAKDQQKDFASLLDKLTAPDKTIKNAKAGPKAIEKVGSGSQMTADLVDALKSQIYRCWSPPTGAPNINELIVDYALILNPDGTVRQAQLLTLSGNPYTQAAAEAASRAIYQCAPYHLPQNRYQDWKEISRMRFDPRQMEQ